MTTPRGAWSIAGAVAGAAGLAVGHAMTMALTLRSSPLVAFAEAVLRRVPEVADDRMGTLIGPQSRGPLVFILVLVALLFSMWAGRLAERSWWQPLLIWLGIGGVCLVEIVLSAERTALDFLPTTAGTVTSIVLLSFVSEPLHRIEDESDTPVDGRSRRSFIIRSGVMGAAGIGVAIYGESFGKKRRHVEQTRRLLNLPVSNPHVPEGVVLGVEGMAPWRTPTPEFFIEHTAVATPTVEPLEWSLRIHGMVDHEIVLSYQDLIDRRIRERWATLSCAKNPVGGDKIGNAWWSGVRISALLEEAGVTGDADAVLQTSQDGWTCGTPLASMLDPNREAMLAIAMNGEPLTLDHGFPVRTIVPGLFGHVSACKWVVDLEVTRFADIEANPTKEGWAEMGPVLIGSRIDVPEGGTEFEAGVVSFAGYAWSQRIGISGVEIALDGGAWQGTELGTVPNQDTWVQWRADVDLPAGDHTVRVRAIGSDGTIQTGVQRDAKPDGATGWHEIEVSAT
ncbi:oxidoreductase [Nocardioides sp. Soil797]|nr:oxidoreductase [Nocardioides sp. Soil797]